MKFFIKVVVTCAAAFLMTVVSSSLQANVIYNVDQQNLASGFTITGTITTDGATGALTPADFLAYNLLVTNGTTTSFSVSSSAASSVASSVTLNNVATMQNQLQATGGITLMPITGLSISFDFLNTLFGLGFIHVPVVEETITIIDAGNEYDFMNIFDVALGDVQLRIGAPGEPAAFILGTAAVPEPSGLVSAGMGILAMISLWAFAGGHAGDRFRLEAA